MKIQYYLTYLKDEPLATTNEFVLDGVTYGRGHFNMEWVKNLVKNPKYIFDVGCYDCGDSIRFKKAFPESEVYSFEASKLRHEGLEKTCQKYGIHLVKCAVTDVDGTATFYDSLVDGNRVDAQGSFYKHTEVYKKRNPRIIQQENGVEVETIRIKTFCEKNNIPSIDVLYVDVEGAELQVIKGLDEYRPKLVFVETLDMLNDGQKEMWHGAVKTKELEEHLSSLGYILIKVLPADRLYIHKNALKELENEEML